MPKRIILIAVLVLWVGTTLILPAVANNERRAGWLKGTEDEKFHQIEKQFRGFDAAMMETGYRYSELYWAGQDKNWGYAQYQIEKMRTAIENGLERRPKRAKSAETFLNIVLPTMEEAVNNKDEVLFRKRFTTLTLTCNACHLAEKVPFVSVQPPKSRISPVWFSSQINIDSKTPLPEDESKAA